MSKPVSRGKPLETPPKRAGDLAQGAVVHVDDAAPGDAADVDLLLVAPVDVVVDHRRQQRMRAGDGVEVAGEVEVHVLHRHDLRIAAPGRAALHPEVGPQRGLADADTRLLADTVQPVAQTDGGRRLAFTGRCGVDGSDQDQLAVGIALDRVDEVLADLGLVMAIGKQMFRRDPQPIADLLDRLLLGLAGDLDIGFVGHWRISPGLVFLCTYVHIKRAVGHRYCFYDKYQGEIDEARRRWGNAVSLGKQMPRMRAAPEEASGAAMSFPVAMVRRWARAPSRRRTACAWAGAFSGSRRPRACRCRFPPDHRRPSRG